MRFFGMLACFAAFSFAPLAWAEEEEDSDDDILDDILNETDEDDSVKSEVEAVKSGEIGDSIGARQEDLIDLEEETRKRRTIKTIQIIIY